MAPITVGYWAIRGLGAPLRMMCDYAGANYEAKMYDALEKPEGGWDLACWFGPKEALKLKNPLMNLPYVVDGDTVVTQSNACFSYLGEKFGMMGSNDAERHQVNQLLCEVFDLRNSCVAVYYNPGSSAADVAALATQAPLDKLNAWFGFKGTTLLMSNNSPCAADFHLWELVDQMATCGPKVFEGRAALKAFYDAFKALPKMQRYFGSKMHKLPINNKMACWGSTPGGGKWAKGQKQDWDASTAAAVPNAAFVFVKPHAATEKVIALAKGFLAGKGIRVLSEGKITAEQIDAKKLIDQHYYAIASKATILKPAELNVPAEKFEAQFGLKWADALKTGDVVNAMDACAAFGVDANALDEAWAKAKKAKNLVKFGGGFYCGLVEMGGKKLYVMNGFFMSMRAKFTTPGTSIYYFSVAWDSGALPWADFRGEALGPTDPADAPADSLRGLVAGDWQGLGLAAACDVGDNGVHASASPFEALAERMNWLGAECATDPFGAALLAAGVPEATIKAWSVDPQVNLPGGGRGSLFDSVEDTDVDDCLAKLLSIQACA